MPIGIKILLIGPRKSGKTLFIHTFLGSNFYSEYRPTQFNGDVKHETIIPITLVNHTNTIDVGFWEINPQWNINQGLSEPLYHNIHGVIVFYDIETYHETCQMINDFISIYPNIHIINVWSKMDAYVDKIDSIKGLADSKEIMGNRPTYLISRWMRSDSGIPIIILITKILNLDISSQ